MKKSIKSGIVAAVVVTAGLAAYQSYGSYGLQDNSLLMQNVEALAEVPDGPTIGDPNGDNGNNKEHSVCKFPADMIACYGQGGSADFRGWKWTHRRSVPFVQKCICLGPESKDCPKGTHPKK